MTDILDLRACRFHALYIILTGAICPDRSDAPQARPGAAQCGPAPSAPQAAGESA